MAKMHWISKGADHEGHGLLRMNAMNLPEYQMQAVREKHSGDPMLYALGKLIKALEEEKANRSGDYALGLHHAIVQAQFYEEQRVEQLYRGEE